MVRRLTLVAVIFITLSLWPTQPTSAAGQTGSCYQCYQQLLTDNAGWQVWCGSPADGDWGMTKCSTLNWGCQTSGQGCLYIVVQG